MPTLTLARFVLEQGLHEYGLLAHSDSKMAAAALYLALRMKALGDWGPALQYYTGTTSVTVTICGAKASRYCRQTAVETRPSINRRSDPCRVVTTVQDTGARGQVLGSPALFLVFGRHYPHASYFHIHISSHVLMINIE